MSGELPPPPDQSQRDAIVRGRDRSFLVEAAAGTGKTHTLIATLLHLALDAEPPVSLADVAAVTFTEKAAGELKQRLRARLADEVTQGPDPIRRARARVALEDVERAEVATIHAFCQTLLKERPIDAGLDPGFQPIDEAASRLVAERIWHDWWRAELAERPDGALAQALRAQASLGRPDDDDRPTVARLAFALYRDRARLDGAPAPAAAPRLLLRRLEGWSNRLAKAAVEAKTPHHPAARWLRQIAEHLGELARHAANPRRFTELARELPKGSLRGVAGLWPDERCEEIQDLVKKVKRLFDGERLAAQVRYWPTLVGLLDRLVDAQTGFLGAVAAEKRLRGFVDFDDLLLLARDLVAGSAAAREHFRRRFQVVAVDEFQDTDPLQMEIVFRLTSPDGGAADWRTLKPEPGRLLLVGDPKQSIYRFRRADVEAYRVARASLERVPLSANRRSVPALIDWVNAVFGGLLTEDPARPFEIGYESFLHWRGPGNLAGPPVVYLEPPRDWRGKSAERDAGEAEAVASFLHSALSERGISPRDVGILVRANARVADFQDALARYGMASVLEGGKDFFEREETAAVLAALRAIDNPRDAVSLYAALKSFLFSFSDEELLRANAAGVRFDATRPGPAAGRLAEALRLVARLRKQRHGRSADQTLADLYDETGAVEAAAAKRVGGLQAQANLQRLLVAAHQLSESGLAFGSVVRALHERVATEVGEPRAFEEKEEAVRILTMHKAKGLEFKVTVVTGLGAPTGGIQSSPILFGAAGEPWAATLAFGPTTVETPDWPVVKDESRRRDLAEEKRLFYVACTRACDLLVLSCFRNISDTKSGPSPSDDADRDSTPYGRFRPHLDPDRLPPGLVERRAASARPRPAPAPDRAADAAAAETLTLTLEELAARPARLAKEKALALRRAGSTGPAEDAAPEDVPGGERERAATSDAAVRIGSAVHETMQAVAEHGADLARAAARAAADWELSAEGHREVERLARRLVGSELFARSAAAPRRLAETPVLFRDAAGFLVEGKIDLLFEEESGFVLVDYKTDLDLTKRMPEYAAQLFDYAAALGALGLEKTVQAAYLLSARTGEAKEVRLSEL